MSKEMELPELDINLADLEKSRTQDALRKHICRDALLLSIYCRERQLGEALAQIAALTAQVKDVNEQCEDIASLGSEWKHRAEKAEAELANECAATPECEERDDWAVRALKAEAELAALREGATVTYRVEFQWGHSKAWEEVPAYVGDCCHATLVGAENHMNSLKPNNTLRIVEVITRERILDTAGGEG